MTTSDALLRNQVLESGLVSKEQLQLSLALQCRCDPQPSLGDVLVREGYLTRTALEELRRGRVPGVAAQTVQEPTLDRARVDARLGGDLGDHLSLLRELEGSELFLAPGSRVAARIRGALVTLSPDPLSPERCDQLIRSALDPQQAELFARERSLEVVLERPDGRYRADLFQQLRGPSGLFRWIPSEPPSLEALRLPRVLERVPRLRQGLVLVTGPRNSGKSTTLAALIERMNQGRRRHIVTIEQPVEHVYASQHCLIAQREVGTDVPSFETALTACLREDPDVIVVSDLGAPERIMTALTAAETGHLVLGTLQTPTAQRTLLRILDAYSGRQRTTVRGMLAAALRMISSQHLIPSADGASLEAAVEVLVVNDAIAAMIREDRLHQIPQVCQTSRGEGMQLLDDALSDLVSAGRISLDEGLSRAEDPNRILRAAPAEELA